MTWPTEQAREAVREPTRLRIEGTWLVREVDEHTCGTGPGGHYGLHEPGCGLIPEVDLSTLPGWAALVRAERAAALREAEADYSHLYLTRGAAAKVVAAVTCADLRARAEAEEADR